MENSEQKRQGLSKWELRPKTIELLVKTKRAFATDSMIYSSSCDNKDYPNFCLVNEKLIYLNKKRPNILVLINTHCSFCIVYNGNNQ